MRIALGVLGGVLGAVLGILIARSVLLDGIEQLGLRLALAESSHIDLGAFFTSSVVLRVLAGGVAGLALGAWGGTAIARQFFGTSAPAETA